MKEKWRLFRFPHSMAKRKGCLRMKKVDFFLGALSPKGFKGYFGELAAAPGVRMYLIQSGPGCGKSTFMKRLGEAAPWDREEIHCSSDPDSLDGVIFPENGIAFVDATAPHTLNAAIPGAGEQVVSLYHTIDADKLQQDQGEIFDLFRQYAALQERASRCFGAAAGLLADRRRAAACCTDFEAVRECARRLAKRYLPKTEGKASEKIRLLSAVTPRGILVFEESVRVLATEKIVTLQDEYGAASRLILELLREDALKKGHHIISCPCCTAPDEKLDHLILPELGLAFVTENSWHPLHFEGQRRVRCARFADPLLLSRCRVRLRFDKMTARELFEETSKTQREAKAIHDEIEEFYKASVDFAEVEKVLRRTAKRIGVTLPKK